MRAPLLFEKLHRLRDEDYHAAGLWGNPAYSGLHRGEDIEIEIPREALEQKVRSSIERFFGASDSDGVPPHLYLFSREGGAGKSHTQHQVRKWCQENNWPFVELWHEDLHEGKVAENIPYLMRLMDTKKSLALLECDHPPEIYEQLCHIEGVYIIGSGHAPSEELALVRDRFEVLDLDRDYPLTQEQIFRLLEQTMQRLRLGSAEIVDDTILHAISQRSRSPGRALNILGVCLAIYTYHVRSGKPYQITVEDVHQWAYRNMPME